MTKCAICEANTGSELRQFESGYLANCTVCGTFGMSSDQLGRDGLLRTGQNERIKVKHMLCERRLHSRPGVFFSDTPPAGLIGKLTRMSVNELLAGYPKEPLAYFDRALETLETRLNHPVAVGILQKDDWPGLFAEGDMCVYLLHRLRDLEFITLTESAPIRFSMLPKGWERIKSLQRPGRDSRQAFVAMWFDEAWRTYYDLGIKPAIEEAGYRPIRIDLEEYNDQVMDRVIAEIRRSRFLVADLRAHRNGVYFEAGFGFGLGIPTIFTVADIDKDAAHFDVSGYPHIRYSTPQELKTKLLNRILATIT